MYQLHLLVLHVFMVAAHGYVLEDSLSNFQETGQDPLNSDDYPMYLKQVNLNHPILPCFDGGLGSECVRSLDCKVKHSECYLETCVCEVTYERNKLVCNWNIVGAECTDDVECGVDHSECPENKDNPDSRVCTCEAGYKAKDSGRECSLVLGGECRDDVDCSVEHSECPENKDNPDSRVCACETGYKVTGAGTECSIVLGGECTKDIHCFFVEHSECSDSQICICEAEYNVNAAGTKCFLATTTTSTTTLKPVIGTSDELP